MNYLLMKDWVNERTDELVQMGVPRVEAEAMMVYVERGAIAAEAKARADRQFLLEFDRVGSVELARRKGQSPQAVCQKRTRILENFNSELNASLNAA